MRDTEPVFDPERVTDGSPGQAPKRAALGPRQKNFSPSPRIGSDCLKRIATWGGEGVGE